MRLRVLLLPAMLALFIIAGLALTIPEAELDVELEEIAELENVFLRESAFYQQRAYPNKEIPIGARLRALRQMRLDHSLNPLAASSRQWRPIGPDSVPNGQPLDPQNSPRISVSGRATAVLIDPGNSNRIWLGAAQGGVWRTEDGGVSWQPLTDNLASLAVGALALDPQDANTIWLGTGEPHFSLDSYYGAGVFKSTDGGTSWVQAGSLPPRARISRIAIDPANRQNVYLATTSAASNSISDTGIFKSNDGGTTWQKSLDGIATDLSIDPTVPTNLIAALGGPQGEEVNGLYRSTDAGATWQPITSLPRGSITGRIELARSRSLPNIVYASIANPGVGGILNLYRSNDGGITWSVVTGTPDYCKPQCFYNNFIRISPTNPSVIFLGGVQLFRSTDGGNSFTPVSTAKQFGPGLHADNHDLAFDPFDANTVYSVNDGGIFRSRTLGDSWTPINRGLATLQFQSVATDPTNGQRAIGGTQDNGTLLYTGAPEWMNIDTGDGGGTAIDPETPDTLYHFYNSLLLARSDDGGKKFFLKVRGLPLSPAGAPLERTLFYPPLAIDAMTPTTLYTGSNRVFRTSDRAENWQPISNDLTKGTGAVSAIAVAPNNSKFIYAGSSDGNVSHSSDGGLNWQINNSGLPNRFVSRIAVDPTNSFVAYVGFSGFGSSHIFKTVNGGDSWLDINNNLPDIPVNAVAVDGNNPNRIYLGTDIGVFFSENGGADWRALNSGLPTVAIFDLNLNRKTGQLIAATHGRGMFALALDGDDDLTPPQVTVLAPQGSESFTGGQRVLIRWQAQDDVGVATQSIELSNDSGNTFGFTIATGLSNQAQSFEWIVPEINTTRARIRVTARDGGGNVGTGISSGDFAIIAPVRPTISGAQLKSGKKSKLLIFGSNFIVNNSVIEVDGRQLQTTKYPKKFQGPGGSISQLQGLDSQLSQLVQPGRKVTLTIVNKGTGLRSAAFDFTP